VRRWGAVLIVLVLAGCGGSGTHVDASRRYETQMASVVPGIQSQILKLRFALEQIRDPIAARGDLRSLEKKLDVAVAKLAAIEPPANVAAAHAKLVAGYRALRTEFAAALGPLSKRRTTDALRVAAGHLEHSAAADQIRAALLAILAKGYKIGVS